jgi:hypothetical protein
MAGGAGVEYYFGYQLPESDLVCEDFRSRDQSWDYCRIALEFFSQQGVPFQKMHNMDRLVGNPENKNSRYCLAEEGSLYLVYLTEGGSADLDLSAASGRFDVRWYNPRSGGDLLPGSVKRVSAGGMVSLGAPPMDEDDDWLVVVRSAD